MCVAAAMMYVEILQSVELSWMEEQRAVWEYWPGKRREGIKRKPYEQKKKKRKNNLKGVDVCEGSSEEEEEEERMEGDKRSSLW